MSINKLILTTENCEDIEIDGKYSTDIDVEFDDDIINKVSFTLLKGCNDYYCSNGNSDKSNILLFDRLMRWRDIVYIKVVFEDGTYKTITVPYGDEDINTNIFMKCAINADLGLEIVIERT